jgi:hypothetical protein
MGTEVESKEMEVGLLRAIAESDAMDTASTTRESFSPDCEDEDAMEDVPSRGTPAMEVVADGVCHSVCVELRQEVGLRKALE